MEVAEVVEVSVKRCHNCGRGNRNRTRKLIVYKRGERYLFPTNDRCWRKTKAKYLVERPYLTCQRVRLLKLFKKYTLLQGLNNYVDKGLFILLSNVNKRRFRY